MIARILGRWAAIGACLLLSLAAPASAGSGKEIVVDFGAGLVYALRDGRLVRGPIITNNSRYYKGKYLGTFRISEKAEEKRSNMYNVHARPLEPGEEGARMPFWMRLGSTAQGFHYSSLFDADGPRHVSHGCYRLSKANAVWLFNWTPIGTPVHVVASLEDSSYAWLEGARSPRTAARPSAKRSASAGSARVTRARARAASRHTAPKVEAERPKARARAS